MEPRQIMSILRFLMPLLYLFHFGCESERREVEKEAATESEGLSREASRGKHFFDDGSVFEGDLVLGEPDGFGRRTFPNADIYEGQFRKGLEHGFGTRRYKSDEMLDRYVGMWSSGKMEGFGALVLTDASRMEGNWKDGRLSHGEYQGVDGEVKTGKWKGNYLNEIYLSEGLLRSAAGDEFSGILKNNGQYQKGALKKSNGDFFVGGFENGLYHGKGILEKNDGTLFVGEFREGEFSGSGVLIDADGSKYTGNFAQGLPDGYGVQEDLTGVVYSGEWMIGIRNGMGTIDFGDGTSYSGEFREGLAYEGIYDWGDGQQTNSYQGESGEWFDR